MVINLSAEAAGARAPEYGFGTLLRGVTLGEARAKVSEAIAAEGFGVLTELDVRATLKNKLGVDASPYLILGACNPALAHRALGIEPYVGLFLPCNIVLWQDGKDVLVTMARPKAMLGVLADDRLKPIADEAEYRLRCAARADRRLIAGVRAANRLASPPTSPTSTAGAPAHRCAPATASG